VQENRAYTLVYLRISLPHFLFFFPHQHEADYAGHDLEVKLDEFSYAHSLYPLSVILWICRGYDETRTIWYPGDLGKDHGLTRIVTHHHDSNLPLVMATCVIDNIVTIVWHRGILNAWSHHS
jgi:hypothetical protein